MSVLSITAPQFTYDDELVERETLDEDELLAAQHDIFGTSEFEETLEMINIGPIELQHAINDIPIEEKEAYLEAIERCPEIVQHESNYIMFLRSENYNVWAAAERLVNYWELRKWLFGPERAFLPMTQTGNGALSESDIELLHKMPIFLLNEQDIHGRTILYFDESRCIVNTDTVTVTTTAIHTNNNSATNDGNGNTNQQNNGDVVVVNNGAVVNGGGGTTATAPTTMNNNNVIFDRIGFVRVIFYFLSVVLEDDETQKKGIVVVTSTRDYHTSRFDRKYYKYLTYLFTGYHPVNTRAFHVCAPAGKSCFLLVLPFIKYFMTKHLRLRFKLHKGTNDEIAIDLNDYGMKHTIFPESMGGSYKVEESFIDWVTERVELETALETALIERHEQLIQERQSTDANEEASIGNFDHHSDDVAVGGGADGIAAAAAAAP